MKPQDCFGVVIRSVGFLVVFAGILIPVGGIVVYPHIARLADPDSPTTAPAWPFLVAALLVLLLGSYLLRGAPLLVRFAYGDQTKA